MTVVIPESVTEIVRSAFSQDDNLTIYGFEGSVAEVYARENRIPFVAIVDYETGDADMDREITIKDATAIQKHLALIEVLEGKALSLADYDEDGVVTIKDATEIQKFIAGII